MSCKKILMTFSLSHALLPKRLLCLAKRSGYPGSWLGTNSRFGRDPNRFNAFRGKSNDFLAKIFFLTLAFMSSRDRNDQWLINHNGRRYLRPKQQKQPPTQTLGSGSSKTVKKVSQTDTSCAVIWSF